MKKTLFFLISIAFFLSFNLNSQEKKNLNIILMIGDGMGMSQITSGMYSLNNRTSLEKMPHIGISKTHSFSSLVTDSAAAGTAIACGEKTINGTLGINPQNKQLKSILEISKDYGYKTGIIATSSIVHATPAAFYANVISRNQYEDIALQLSQNEVDFFVGGGRDYFTKRDDKRNLIKEMSDYDFVYSIKKFNESTSNKIGFFTSLGDPYRIIDGRKPKLSDAIEAMLDKISSYENPFFLVVESSQIDWAGHANDFNWIKAEFQEFDEAIQSAINFSNKNKNTLIIVTADHETGGLAITGGKVRRFTMRTKWGTIGHTAEMVPVFSTGPKSETFSGIYDNTDIFKKILNAIEN